MERMTDKDAEQLVACIADMMTAPEDRMGDNWARLEDAMDAMMRDYGPIYFSEKELAFLQAESDARIQGRR